MKTTLDSRQFLAFDALACTGSFTRAARELNLTQSGVSHSMKALEGESGLSPFGQDEQKSCSYLIAIPEKIPET